MYAPRTLVEEREKGECIERPEVGSGRRCRSVTPAVWFLFFICISDAATDMSRKTSAQEPDWKMGEKLPTKTGDTPGVQRQQSARATDQVPKGVNLRASYAP